MGPEWPFYIKFCVCVGACRIFCEDFKNNCVKTSKDKPILSAAETVVSGKLEVVGLSHCHVEAGGRG